MEVNLIEMTWNEDGYDVSVSLANGFAESIEGLYDMESALDYGRMHLSYQTNKYVRG
jgi:hypothetical protein